MAAVVKSRENVSVSLTGTAGIETQTVNLTKGQDHTKCTPLGVTMRFTSNATDARANNAAAVELIDNSGTAAVKVSRQGSSTRGAVVVEVEVIEWGSNVTVQSGSSSLTGSSVTATISSVNTDRSFIIPTCLSNGASGDRFTSFFVSSKFNSSTQIVFHKGGSQNPDWTVYWYVVTSDNGDFEVEHCEYSLPGGTGNSVTYDLSNTVNLDHAFIVATIESRTSTDDMLNAIWGTYFSSTSQLTSIRNGSTYGANFRVAVVRGSSSEFTVQRYSPYCGLTTTTNQTITTVDLDKATLISQTPHISQGSWFLNNSTAGNDVDDYQTALTLTSTTNARAQRRTGIRNDANNNLYFEVVEFELEGGGPTPQVIPVGLVSETDTVDEVKPVAGAVSVAVGLVSEADSVLEVTPSIVAPPQIIPVGLISETDFVDEVKAVPGAVSVAVGLVSETDAVFEVTPTIVAPPQTVVVEAIGETDTVLEVNPVAGAVSVPVGLISETDSVLEVKAVPGPFVVAVETITETDVVAPVFPVIEGGPQTVLVVNVAEVDTVFPVTPIVPTIEGRNQEEDFFIGIRIGI